jgi:hypothetical protein
MDTTQEVGRSSVKKLVFLANDANDSTWQVITDHLKKHGQLFTEHYSPEGARKLVFDGSMDLWVGGYDENGTFFIEIYAFTSILQYDKKRAFMIWFVGGKFLKHYLPTLEIFRGYANEKHCTCIEMNARPGIERIAKKVGFVEKMVHLSLSLRNKKELN